MPSASAISVSHLEITFISEMFDNRLVFAVRHYDMVDQSHA
jgi:hypothetical protein